MRRGGLNDATRVVRSNSVDPRPLAFADVKPVLIRLERIADSVVVVGGQAVMERELAVRRARRRATDRNGREHATGISEAKIDPQLRESSESVRAERKPKKPKRG